MTETCFFTGRLLRSGLLALGAAICCAAPGAALAQANINPYASVQAEHDSNVFRVENSQIAEQFYHDPTLGDTDFRYIVGLDGTYLWSLQKLTANVEGREIDYEHYTFLNHSEYLANFQLDWKVADVLDGIVQFRQEHMAAYFADSDSPYLEIDTDRNLVAKLNFRFHTDWRLETGLNFRTYEAPLQNYPDFVDHETGSHLGLSYLGIANLTYGFGVDRIDGNYVNAPGVGPYTQTTESLRMNYVINGLQTLSGQLGYTKRNQTDEQNLSAWTGQVKYLRQLTGKTSITVQFVRSVNSYIASAGSEIDTVGSVGAQWQATYKLQVNVSLAYQTSSYIGQVIAGSTANGRTDHLPTEIANVIYQPIKRVQIKAYVNAQTRHSNVAFDRFDDTTAGVQITGHWR